MKKLCLIFLVVVMSHSQVFVPLKMKYFVKETVDSLSVFIKQDKKFYHVANFIQTTGITKENNDTLLSRSQVFDAVNADYKFTYDVKIKRNLGPVSIKLTTSDSIENHIFSEKDITTFTQYFKLKPSNKKKVLPFRGLIFEDNNLDVVLGSLIMKIDQEAIIPLFLTEDYKIEKVTITFAGIFMLKLGEREFKAKQFKVKGSDFEQFYWLRLEDNALLQYESPSDNLIMIKKNFNSQF